MVAYFLINLPMILLLSRKILHLHANPFAGRFLDLLLLPSPPSAFTSSVATLWFTHFEQLLSPGKLNVTLLPSAAFGSH